MITKATKQRVRVRVRVVVAERIGVVLECNGRPVYEVVEYALPRPTKKVPTGMKKTIYFGAEYLGSLDCVHVGDDACDFHWLNVADVHTQRFFPEGEKEMPELLLKWSEHVATGTLPSNTTTLSSVSAENKSWGGCDHTHHSDRQVLRSSGWRSSRQTNNRPQRSWGGETCTARSHR